MEMGQIQTYLMPAVMGKYSQFTVYTNRLEEV